MDLCPDWEIMCNGRIYLQKQTNFAFEVMRRKEGSTIQNPVLDTVFFLFFFKSNVTITQQKQRSHNGKSTNIQNIRSAYPNLLLISSYTEILLYKRIY